MGWRRVGTSAALVVIGAIMLAFSALALAVGVAVIVSRAAPVVGLAIGLPAAAAYTGLACRLLMVGTYVGAEGLRIRKPLRTLAFGWSEVLSVRSRKVTRTVSSPPQMVTARRVCFDLTDGQTVESPLYGAMRGAGRPGGCPASCPPPSTTAWSPSCGTSPLSTKRGAGSKPLPERPAQGSTRPSRIA